MIVLKFYFAGILCFKTSCNDVNDLDKIVSKFFDDNRVFTHLETTYTLIEVVCDVYKNNNLIKMYNLKSFY